jgi:hypothetical protein
MGLALAALIKVFLSYHPRPRETEKPKDATVNIAKIDFVGGLLSMAGATLFLLGLQFGGYN